MYNISNYSDSLKFSMFRVSKYLAQALSSDIYDRHNFNTAQQWFDWAIGQISKPAFNPKVEVFSPFRRPFSDGSLKVISSETEKCAVCCACTACTACGGTYYFHDDNKAPSDVEKLRIEAEKKKKEEEQKERELLLHAAKKEHPKMDMSVNSYMNSREYVETKLSSNLKQNANKESIKSENNNINKTKFKDSDLDQMKKDNTYWERIAKFLATELEKEKVLGVLTFTRELSAEDWMLKAINQVSNLDDDLISEIISPSFNDKTLPKINCTNIYDIKNDPSIPWMSGKPTKPGLYYAYYNEDRIHIAKVYSINGILYYSLEPKGTNESDIFMVEDSTIEKWAGPYRM